ncbi:hypothetical protein OIDMADRAFT_50586 [Oidiodendron maius Zn]|uniref:Pkr1-domain-containing protein n=1 Tax=Oidiodendron maius (strain Zn) TaxID=913774 RepID=A0A0C3D0H1_OIDMZ|nr:hypothetical protein OIDMADRAFT_50586 [Oidiodendron maius Zn]
MSTFFVDLVQSIFIPGPTSTLVLATNVSFACLQLVLLVLLLTTYSIHFAILSILSAGLWWGINWFVTEVQALKSQEEEEARKKRQADDAADDTETEAEIVVTTKKSTSGSTSLEPQQQRGDLKDRGDWGSRSEISTEDEWERVDENEKEKEK